MFQYNAIEALAEVRYNSVGKVSLSVREWLIIMQKNMWLYFYVHEKEVSCLWSVHCYTEKCHLPSSDAEVEITVTFLAYTVKKQRVALQKYIKKTDKSMSSTINNTFFCFFFYFFILLNFGRITSVKLFCDDVVWSGAQKVLGRILKSWAFLTMLTERFYLKKGNLLLRIV